MDIGCAAGCARLPGALTVPVLMCTVRSAVALPIQEASVQG